MFKINWAAYLLLVLIIGCTSETKKPESKVEHPVGNFPKLTSLNFEKDNTAFATTLESKIDLSKNTVYAATLLFCWDKFEKQYGQATGISKPGLRTLNNSKCFRNTLKKDEYKTTVEAYGNIVKIISVFDIQLPFGKPMGKQDGVFKGTKIKAFGTIGENHQIEIIYYHSDTDFALRLLPENEEHEIIICQSDFSGLKTLKDQFQSIQSKRKAFLSNAKPWMKQLNDKDEVSIPQLGFNLDTHFKTIEGAKYNTPGSPWEIVKAYQQNALLMNEKGVAAYSKAIIITEATAIQPSEKEIIKIPVKRLLVNSNYVVFFKRKDCNWPYFGAFIANTRWMKPK